MNVDFNPVVFFILWWWVGFDEHISHTTWGLHFNFIHDVFWGDFFFCASAFKMLLHKKENCCLSKNNIYFNVVVAIKAMFGCCTEGLYKLLNLFCRVR